MRGRAGFWSRDHATGGSVTDDSGAINMSAGDTYDGAMRGVEQHKMHSPGCATLDAQATNCRWLHRGRGVRSGVFCDRWTFLALLCAGVTLYTRKDCTNMPGQPPDATG